MLTIPIMETDYWFYSERKKRVSSNNYQFSMDKNRENGKLTLCEELTL